MPPYPATDAVIERQTFTDDLRGIGSEPGTVGVMLTISIDDGDEQCFGVD
jgi:hypothetical protein